ncbi:hypothetical protein LEP1GSC203_2868 [Leptospira terpstrae serovar Hualin str. LT 11-33 = ATCC 700639]|uniref:Uncharacterized protein n=1 Tax=Leptospira terpstrae serovar Hualin str. LT 11-33 = ATCC 700639 TaxID=1257025 RepID=N1W0M3_9LEPT|nr:hypothetical protein LEP1GSC203_2868 [Leptospira terpstrae serovar Hualin str. LT 11-33 = ATCC 700639]
MQIHKSPRNRFPTRACADEVGLKSDPEIRADFVGSIEWGWGKTSGPYNPNQN